MPDQEQNQQYDVTVIGAGVVGASIARRLSAYQLRVALVEKEADVSFGTSKANSGIIHGGFHHEGSYLKTKLELQGNMMFDQLQRELHFPFKRCGILVAAMNEEELKAIQFLYHRGRENGSAGIELCSRERTLELEPKLSPDVVGGLYAPIGGIIEPYRFVFSLVESALRNGVELYRDFQVSRVERDGADDFYRIFDRQDRKILSRYVVNAAGLYADEVSQLFGAEEFQITPRKGEYYLLDRMTQACPSKVLFPVPNQVSKGMLVIPTVEGTVLVGPTAEEIRDKEDLSTSREKLDSIFDSARRMVPKVSTRDVITSFSGLRPVLEGDDFYIEVSKKAPRLIQAAGIQSPGLTAAPAIGEYVKDLLKKAGLPLQEKPDYQAEVPRVPRVRDRRPFDVDDLVRRNPAYGNIVCRCEEVSEAEIIEAIRRGHRTLDGIKFFTRSGMGRCQGGFCTAKIIEIIMRETGLPYHEISKRGKESRVFWRSL
ncbi:MAG TPA: FAD/NAD(P)-binding oxidoreductase [Sediminispirochaeta sp.]|mgnify:CR=1 FL=1|nr:FAD/NAD(P)-binding oxidoreductase [Sediminispirochaeta sp.]